MTATPANIIGGKSWNAVPGLLVLYTYFFITVVSLKNSKFLSSVRQSSFLKKQMGGGRGRRVWVQNSSGRGVYIFVFLLRPSKNEMFSSIDLPVFTACTIVLPSFSPLFINSPLLSIFPFVSPVFLASLFLIQIFLQLASGDGLQ